MPISDWLTAAGLLFDLVGVISIWQFGLPTPRPTEERKDPTLPNILTAILILSLIRSTFIHKLFVAVFGDYIHELMATDEAREIGYHLFDMAGLLLLVIGFGLQLLAVVLPHWI